MIMDRSLLLRKKITPPPLLKIKSDCPIIQKSVGMSVHICTRLRVRVSVRYFELWAGGQSVSRIFTGNGPGLVP